MDLHGAFEDSIKKFPSLEGLIFADPDGEAILFDGPIKDSFYLKLAGAKMPILMAPFYHGAFGLPPLLEILYDETYVLAIRLSEDYSITAIGNDLSRREQVKSHLFELAEKFNQDIV